MQRWACVLVALVACGGCCGDDAAAAPAPDASVCPAPASGCTSVVCAGRCFELCSAPVSSTVAHQACTARGGCLAQVDSGELAVCLGVALASSTTMVAWVGVTQSSTATVLDQGWTWSCTNQ